ncbi:unnamed protein product [Phyllotreta striolata]|uniref:Uncharacterized protein n=1 Tax=Phyllotreta striolata TaxID=444603 RepID=A0A9N9TUB7_PHYSR|nr:unnamed protein product [Phyllotreta striolata]
MMYVLLLFVLLSNIIQVRSKCTDENYLKIEKDIISEKEKIGDELLLKYGDVPGELGDLLQQLRRVIGGGYETLKIQKGVNGLLKDRENGLNNRTDGLYGELEVLRRIMAGLNVDSINFNDTIAKNIDDSILKKIKDMEDQLKLIDVLYNNYSNLNIFEKNMNIPNRVSNDLSIIENLLTEKEDPHCSEKLEEKLNKLFRELLSLLDFKELAEEVLELKEIAQKKNEASKNLLNLVKEYIKIEAKFHELQDIINKVEEILKSLGLNKLSDIPDFIRKNEDEIDDYINEINCYRNYIINCHIKHPSDSTNVPICMKSCEGDNKIV